MYRKNRFDEAAHRYGYAVRRIPVNVSNNNNSVNIGDSIFKDSNNKNFENDEMENNNNPATLVEDLVSPISTTFSQLKIHLLLNLSRCQRRLGRYNILESSHTVNQMVLFRSQKLKIFMKICSLFSITIFRRLGISSKQCDGCFE